jgi:hypothetical protein
VSSEDGRVACVAELGEWLPMAHDGGVVHARERSTDHFYRHDDIPFAATAPRQGARSKALSIRAYGSKWGGSGGGAPGASVCCARLHVLAGVQQGKSCPEGGSGSVVGPHDLKAKTSADAKAQAHGGRADACALVGALEREEKRKTGWSTHFDCDFSPKF